MISRMISRMWGAGPGVQAPGTAEQSAHRYGRARAFCRAGPEDPEPTQFERAVRALEIEPILALSPQAKGRVERAFQTLQDRLVKALRLAGIGTLEAANAFLPAFIARYNARFARAPRAAEHAHRALHVSEEQLRWITSEQHPRTLSKSLSCQYRGQLYLIQTAGAPAYHLRGARISVCEDGSEEPIVLLHQGKPLPYRVFARHDLPDRIADDKTVDAMIEQAKKKQAEAIQPAPRRPTTPGAGRSNRRPQRARALNRLAPTRTSERHKCGAAALRQPALAPRGEIRLDL